MEPARYQLSTLGLLAPTSDILFLHETVLEFLLGTGFGELLSLTDMELNYPDHGGILLPIRTMAKLEFKDRIGLNQEST